MRIEMSFLIIKQLVISIILCSFVACASTEQGEPEEAMAAESTGSDCISQNTIRDYTILDKANLIVAQGASRKYHVELSRPAHGLNASRAVGFQSQSGLVCGRFSEILIDDGFNTEKIRISSIRRLTPEREEELLIRYGKIEPEFEQTRQPQKVEGAEVEELD
jgi:hypothetical protein